MQTKAEAIPAALRLPQSLEGLQDLRVDVVGVGSVEGGEIARYLLDAGFTRVVGHDLSSDLEELGRAHSFTHAALPREERRQRLERLLQGLAELNLGARYLQGVQSSKLVVPTQAWFMHPRNRPLLDLAEAGHPFYSLVQAYLDLARGPVLGVTGSHGKSTTSALVARGLRRVVPLVWLAGNDRHSRQALEDVARDHEGRGCLVLEISNRQLLQLRRAPQIGCITNITPNHLEEHGGMEGYVACKRRMFDLPGVRSAVRNGDDPRSRATGPVPAGVRELIFASDEELLGDRDGCFEADGWAVVRRSGKRVAEIPLEGMRLLGEHNRANLRAALAVCSALPQLGADEIAAAGAAMVSLPALPHRTQLVWQEGDVNYYDDLSSTTPQSTVAAIRAVGRPAVLICGGDDKGIDFSDLVGLVGNAVKALVLLPGAGSDRLISQIPEGQTVVGATSIAEAVARARELVRPGGAVILSPACPGFFTAHYGGGGFRQALRDPATSPRRRRAPR